jgi:hydrogenase-4 component B
LTLQSLLHLGYEDAAGVSFAGAVAAAALAATAALAAFCFVKVVGLALLGAPRTPEAVQAVEPPPLTRLAMVLLAASCVVLGVIPGWLLPTLAGLAPGPATLASGLALDLPGTGSFTPLVLLAALAILVGGVHRVLAAGGRTAPTPAWTCGQLVTPRLQWTSAGFTKPLRLVLEAVFRTRREFEIQTDSGVVRLVRYRADVPHLFDTLLYGPTQRFALRIAAVLRRSQSGSLRAYVVYLLVLVLALLVLARIGQTK